MAHELNKGAITLEPNKDTILEPRDATTLELNKDTTTEAVWKDLGISDFEPFRRLNSA